jgi:hypothetical protein
MFDSVLRLTIVFALAGLLVAGPAYSAAPNLPDHDRTPGASDPDITQANHRECCAEVQMGKNTTLPDETICCEFSRLIRVAFSELSV